MQEVVMFTVVRGDILRDGPMLLFNSIYAPMTTRDLGWPDNVRREFTEEVRVRHDRAQACELPLSVGIALLSVSTVHSGQCGSGQPR